MGEIEIIGVDVAKTGEGKPTTIKITRRRNEDGEHLELSFAYNWDFIEALKAAVYPGDRSYNPQTKIWRVAAARAADVFELARAMFDAPIYEYRDEDDALVTENLKTGERTEIASLF